jgi:Rod binding domain-containing protein
MLALPPVSALAPAATPREPTTPQQVAQVARDFEALLLTQVLKALRRTVPEASESEGGGQRQIYLELFDEFLATDLTRKGGIGLGAAIRRYLEPQLPAGPRAAGMDLRT